MSFHFDCVTNVLEIFLGVIVLEITHDAAAADLKAYSGVFCGWFGLEVWWLCFIFVYKYADDARYYSCFS